MKDNFTPGPWIYHQVSWPFEGWQITDSSKRGKYVALIKKGSFNRAGNLQLIAAAPDLLYALRELLAAVKAEPAMNNKKYDQLGIVVNRALNKVVGLE